MGTIQKSRSKGEQMTKSSQFVKLISLISNSVDKNKVKEAIGDSSNNHRTLSVNQMIRFLSTRPSQRLVGLGNSLNNVYTIVRSSIASNRGRRTDAIDMSEFLGTVKNKISTKSKTFNRINKQRIGRVVNF